MPAIGNCWKAGSWRDDVWAAGSWRDGVAPLPAPSSDYPGGFARLGYSGPRGPAHLGTAQSERAKRFARYLDEALEAPDEKGLPAKKKKHAPDVAALQPSPRVIALPVPAAPALVRIAGVGAIHGLRSTTHVSDCAASGGAGAACAVTPAMVDAVATLAAEGIDNPTDDELTLIADSLSQLARG